jgi:hypothetical protein
MMRVELPEEEAKQVTEGIAGTMMGESLVIQAWGMELVIHHLTPTGGFEGYLNDTAD